jgi:hypothetical protein
MQLEDGPGHGAPSADGSDSSRERKMILPPSKASAKPPRSPRRRWTGIGASRPIPSSIASPPIFPLLLPCVAARSALATFRLFIYRAAHIRQNPKDDARPGGRGKGGSRQWQHPHLALAAFGWLEARAAACHAHSVPGSGRKSHGSSLVFVRSETFDVVY